MKNILKNIESILRFVRYRTVYPFTEMAIRNLLDNKSFHQYLCVTNRVSNITDRAMNLTNDGRVRIKQFEVDIVKGCNLKCKYCTHVSPLRNGYIPLDQLSEWFETWSKKLAPERFFILGGEPLLHPEVEKVILTVGKYWRGSNIIFVTNGMILPKKSDSVFEAIRAINATIHI
jgi:sulfatase maturation enzyme AslB (radical SAM superfamily)